MEEKNHTDIIPENNTGKEITAEAAKELTTIDESRLMYIIAKERLRSVNNWQTIAGRLSANFLLTDNKGNEVNRFVQKGDHFMIDILGLGTKVGEGLIGYVWKT